MCPAVCVSVSPYVSVCLCYCDSLCVCVYVFVCVCVGECGCVRVCVCVCSVLTNCIRVFACLSVYSVIRLSFSGCLFHDTVKGSEEIEPIAQTGYISCYTSFREEWSGERMGEKGEGRGWDRGGGEEEGMGKKWRGK